MSKLKSLFARAPVRPQGTSLPLDAIERSYFLMRLVVGGLGFALPWLLFLGDWVFLDEDWTVRGSLSAYYHSGMRDAFVSILAVAGILLVTYKYSELNRDNTYSIAAGMFAVGVAIFPTGIPPEVDAQLTPLQEELGEGTTQAIHFVCAAAFIFFLALICYDFATRERERGGPRAEGWYRFHLAMTGGIGLGVALIPILKATNFLEDHAILIGETIVVVAFGLSWLAKSWNESAWPKVTRSSS